MYNHNTCIYIYIHTCICICMYVCMHTCISVYLYIYICTHLHILVGIPDCQFHYYNMLLLVSHTRDT